MQQDIIYVDDRGHGGTSGHHQDYHEKREQQSIQYVTPQQQTDIGKRWVACNCKFSIEINENVVSFSSPEYATPQVHEESGHTYSAGARQSLINPIIHKPSSTPSPYLAQQPRYVYVQAGAQELQPSGFVTYGQPQHSQQNTVQLQQQVAQDDIAYANIEPNQSLDVSPQSVHAPLIRQHAIDSEQQQNIIQYLPLVSQNP